jgi:hypothetical protein
VEVDQEFLITGMNLEIEGSNSVFSTITSTGGGGGGGKLVPNPNIPNRRFRWWRFLDGTPGIHLVEQEHTPPVVHHKEIMVELEIPESFWFSLWWRWRRRSCRCKWYSFSS